jgi:hypothetical protein
MKSGRSAWGHGSVREMIHRALDAAVCAAYGWDAAILNDEEEILKHLLALNLQRAGD